MDPFALSVVLASLTTVILMILGVPLAYWLATSRHPSRPLVEATVALPLVLPPTVLGYYMLMTLGAAGPLGQAWTALTGHPLAFTFEGLVVASVVYSLPFAVQPAQAAFAGLDPRLREAALTLGATPGATMGRVILPAAAPGLLAAAVLTFAHTLGEFGVVLMVGGSVEGRTRTISVAIYDMVESLDTAGAARASLGLLVLSYLTLLVVYALNRQAGRLGPWR